MENRTKEIFFIKLVQPNLLHRNGVNEPRLSFSTISAVVERFNGSLHELLIIKQFTSIFLIHAILQKYHLLSAC